MDDGSILRRKKRPPLETREIAAPTRQYRIDLFAFAARPKPLPITIATLMNVRAAEPAVQSVCARYMGHFGPAPTLGRGACHRDSYRAV